jgi:hypothetical protein
LRENVSESCGYAVDVVSKFDRELKEGTGAMYVLFN